MPISIPQTDYKNNHILILPQSRTDTHLHSSNRLQKQSHPYSPPVKDRHPSPFLTQTTKTITSLCSPSQGQTPISIPHTDYKNNHILMLPQSRTDTHLHSAHLHSSNRLQKQSHPYAPPVKDRHPSPFLKQTTKTITSLFSPSQGQTPISIPHTQTTKTIASLSAPNQGQIPISIPHTHTTKTTVSLSYPSQEQNRHSSLFLTLSTKTIVSSLSSVVDEQSYFTH